MAPSLVRHRVRSRAALAAVAVVSVGVLSACGFSYATDQIYNSSVGTNHRTGPVDVLSAVVVSSVDGQGTFIATFNNNSEEVSDTVTALSPGPAAGSLEITGFTPLDLAPGAFVNIADSEQIRVTGDFIPGTYLDIVMDLENAETIEMSVPVVPAVDEYEGLDVTATEAPAPTESADAPAQPPSESPSGAAPVPSETPAVPEESATPAE